MFAAVAAVAAVAVTAVAAAAAAVAVAAAAVAAVAAYLTVAIPYCGCTAKYTRARSPEAHSNP